MRIGTTLLVAALSVACFGDPPPPAEELPLEIVVHPDECLLNYPRVGPGRHELTVIFEGPDGSVRIRTGNEEMFASGGPSLGDPVLQVEVELETGTILIICQAGEREFEVPLQVREGLPPGGN